MKACPSCKLTNPDNAQYCECGYCFRSGAVEQDHPNEKSAPNIKKNRLVFGVDIVSIILAPPLAKVLGLGGAIPIVALGAACFYGSSFITSRISRSSLSRGQRIVAYTGLAIGYFVLSVLLFGLAAAIHGQQSR
jgi:hypothetical protein